MAVRDLARTFLELLVPLFPKLGVFAFDVCPVECGTTVLWPASGEGVLVGDVVSAAVGSRVRDCGPPQGSVLGIVGAGTEV